MDYIMDILKRLPVPIPSFSEHPIGYMFMVSFYIVALLMQFSAMYQDFILFFQPRKIKSLLDIAIRPFIYYMFGGFIVRMFFPRYVDFWILHILCLLIYGIRKLILKTRKSQNMKLIC